MTEEEDVTEGLKTLEEEPEHGREPSEQPEIPMEVPAGVIPLEDVAGILEVKDVQRFIELFNTDLPRWKEEADNLYHSRMVNTEQKRGELEIFRDDDENDNFWSRITKVCDGLIDLMTTNRADYKAMGDALDKAVKANKKAIALKDKNQFYAKIMQDKESLYLAKQAIDYYYVSVIESQSESVIADNVKMADTLKKLADLSEEVKQIAKQYEKKE